MQVAVVDYRDVNVAKAFVETIRETGFGVISHHPISHDLIDQVYQDWKVFFAQSPAEKNHFLFRKDFEKVQDGFFPMEMAEKAKGYDVKDIKEFFHLYPCRRNQVPSCISEATWILREEMISLACVLLGWLETALPEHIRSGLSMSLSDMVDTEFQTLLRILHYPPLPATVEPGAIRAAAHEDINLITLLVAASAPGLEVMDNADQWHEVPVAKNNIAVNVGDMLQECTRGYYRATKHRVVNPQGESAKLSRYSIPLFLHAKDGVVLSSRYTACSYRRERFAELGLVDKK